MIFMFETVASQIGVDDLFYWDQQVCIIFLYRLHILSALIFVCVYIYIYICIYTYIYNIKRLLDVRFLVGKSSY